MRSQECQLPGRGHDRAEADGRQLPALDRWLLRRSEVARLIRNRNLADKLESQCALRDFLLFAKSLLLGLPSRTLELFDDIRTELV